MKKTKIICTIGPASNSYETIVKMAKEGMNVARLNLSHGNQAENQKISKFAYINYARYSRPRA